MLQSAVGTSIRSNSIRQMPQASSQPVGAERNALAAHLVTRAEHWPWGSAWTGNPPALLIVDESPLPRPSNWLETLNDR